MTEIGELSVEDQLRDELRTVRHDLEHVAHERDEAKQQLKQLTMLERMASQHASRRDADIAEADHRLAQAKAEIARLNAAERRLYADLLDEKVKAENELDVLRDCVSGLLAVCNTVGWISSCQVRELLEVGCDRAACSEPRPHEHITLDGEGEKATGGIVTESIVVGESGCSLPHMPLPKGGIPTGQKVTVHVSDPALREVIDKALDLRDCTEDAAYDKESNGA